MVEKKAPKIRKPSAATAKQEMLSAYSEVVKDLDIRREDEMKPEARMAEKAEQAAVAAADDLSTEPVNAAIGQIKSEVGKILAQIADRLESELVRYQQTKRAVVVKEKELQEIYEIQKSASTLTALLEAQQQKRDEFEADIAERKAELTAEIEQTRAAWEEEKKRRDLETKERDAAEQKRRVRENEEYQYQFKREQQLTREKFEDEKTRLERDLQTRKAQVEAALTEREKVVAAREAELAELRRQAENAPKELDTAVARAVKETTARLQQESKASEELIRREFAGEKNVLLARVDGLEKTAKEQTAQIAKLTQQLEKAYSQVQDIAVKTVEGAGSAKSLTHLEQIVTEQARKQTQEK